MPDVSCLGILVADIWAKPVDEWPERGRLGLVDRIGMNIGGCAANSGVDLAKLGADVAVLGKVGADGFGDFVVNVLESYGVKAAVARSERHGTSATMIMVDSEGERTFIHYIGANGDLRPEDLDMDVVLSSRILHFAGALVMPGFDGEPAASVMRQAREAGVMTSLDVVWDATGKWMETLEPCLREADIFLPSLAEAEQLTGEKDVERIAEVILSYGVKIVAIKMGGEGSYVRSADGRELRVPVYPVEVVDGTGSGDAYAAGFLRGLLEGWDLERCAKFAAAVGALCVTALGTIDGVRSFEETLAWLKSIEPDYW